MVEEEPAGATSEEIQSAADRIFSLGGDAEAEEATEEAAADTIADLVIASANGDPAQFTTLLAAVSAADPAILEALRNPDAGVTVFAPTDAAFAALAEAVGQETFDAILADQALLTQILQYHVVPQVVDSATVVELLEGSEGEVVTETLLEGATLTITSTDEGIFINDAPLLLDAVDIIASNGIIHTIDGVLVPQAVLDALAAPAEEEMVEEEPAGATSEEIQSAADRIFSLGNDDGMEDMEAEEESSDMGAAGTIVDIAAGDENFSMLVLVLTEAAPEYVELLSDPNASYTVFAPTNAAFDELAEGLGVPIEDALAFPDILADILAYHVVEGTVPAETVLTLDGQEVLTVQGESILVTIDGETVLLNGDVTVSATDVFASNGVIHVIDSVMLPESTIATLQSLGLNP
jgi:transforming growth factor-beta-induced protein